MNSINNICERQDFQVLENENLDKSLPYEVFLKVFSYLDDGDRTQAGLVSHLWNYASIDLEKRKEFSLIKNFANFLGHNLNEEYKDSRKKLFEIGSDSKILNCIDLMQVKSSILETKESIVIVLESLTPDEIINLKNLGNVELPKCFENVFDLAEINQGLEKAKLMPDCDDKENALYKAAISLMYISEMDKAIEVANMLTSEMRNLVLDSVYRELINRGDADKSIEVAKMLDKDNKNYAFGVISKKLVHGGNVDKSLEVAQMINNEDKDFALQCIFDVLKKENMDKAIEVVHMITNESYKSYALQDIYCILKNSGCLDKAQEIKEQLEDLREKLGFRRMS